VFRKHPLFSAAGTPSAATVVTAGNEPTAAQLLAAAGKNQVTNAPGVTLTIEQYNQLLANQQQLAALQAQLDAMKPVLDATKKLYSGEPMPVDEAKAQVRKVMVHAGLSGQQLEDAINAAIVSEEPSPEPEPKPNTPPANTGRGTPAPQGTPPVSNAPATPPKPSLDQIALRQMVAREVKNTARAAVEAAPGYKKAVELIRGRYTDKAVADKKVALFEAEHLKRAEAAISEHVIKKRNETGNLDLDWIKEAGDTVTSQTAEQIELVFGDPNLIGRAPGVTEDEPFDVARQKPVELKGVDEATGTLDVENFDDYATDRIMRGLAESGTGSGASVL